MSLYEWRAANLDQDTYGVQIPVCLAIVALVTLFFTGNLGQYWYLIPGIVSSWYGLTAVFMLICSDTTEAVSLWCVTNIVTGLAFILGSIFDQEFLSFLINHPMVLIVLFLSSIFSWKFERKNNQEYEKTMELARQHSQNDQQN